MKRTLLTLCCTLAVAGCTARADALTPLEAPALPVAVAEDDSSYAAGTRAMNESRWQDAVTAFDQVVETKGRKADAALYWKAYSLNKLNKPQLALETCMKLQANFKASQWNKDCAALQLNSTVEWKRAAGNSPSPYSYEFEFTNPNARSKDPDADLKMLALNSLINRDPAQALPILRNVLSGQQSAEMKQHALFVLAQSRSPEAQTMIHDAIQGKQGAALQRQAIQASGIYMGQKNNPMLAEVYRTTADPLVKKSIISALYISNDDAHLVALARTEKDVAMKRALVSQLSLMQGKAANDYMMELLK